ncbi:MAG TPA: cytochrome P450 [Amycolatopsis sp.]|uniref:cytochrome P450 n=1 Tax=Amycolatopsis sp. TaxID=37632 RepID=UPI002B494E52|nr:cytochrome P450 [Amycolatopsis sp.]HKS50112.1 cytochrome P450 [Amycolatopsis sp.]
MNHGSLPPGPPLPAFLQTIMWAVAPTKFGKACMDRYGSLFTARILGFGSIVYICTPDGIRRILRDDADNFDAAAANKSIRFLVGDHSLLMSEGAAHTRRRRVLMRPLHGDNVAGYVELMESIVEQEIRRWAGKSRIRLLERFQRVTLEVMMRAVFGITDSSRLDRLRVLVPRLLDINPLIILLPASRRRFGGLGPWAAFQRLLAEVDEIIFAEIAERRAAGGHQGADVVSILLARSDEDAVSDQELRDHLVTLLAVGQETTATQLAWFFERVLRTPDVLDRVVTAVGTGDWKFVDAAIHESVRVRPTTMDLGRVTKQVWQAHGYAFPPGTMFAVSLGLLHLSPDLHERPGDYSVDRFYPAEPPSTHFLPFGGGSHRCLGASLAMVEMRTIIGTILRHVRLGPARWRAERISPKGPMLVPARGTEVVVVENRLTEREPAWTAR